MHILGNCSLSDVSLANTLFVTCLLLFTLTFTVEVFHFNEAQLIISFKDCVFDIVSKQSLSHPRSPRFSILFSSRS